LISDADGKQKDAVTDDWGLTTPTIVTQEVTVMLNITTPESLPEFSHKITLHS